MRVQDADGNIQVLPGKHLPLIPSNRVKVLASTIVFKVRVCRARISAEQIHVLRL
jgi:hypothetical protein